MAGLCVVTVHVDTLLWGNCYTGIVYNMSTEMFVYSVLVLTFIFIMEI